MEKREEGARTIKSGFFNALRCGNLEMVKDYVEQKGIDANQCVCDHSGSFGYPLHIACRFGYLPIVRYLVEECKVDAEFANQRCTKAVNVACIDDKLEIIRYLAKECHVNLEGGTYSFGSLDPSVLIYAVQHTCDVPTIRFLVQECQVNVNSTIGSWNGLTALHIASLKDYFYLVVCLTQYGHADVEIKDDEGYTPLMHASNKCNFETAQYLIQNCNANVDVKNNSGCTALHICCKIWEAKDIAEFLISECHANVEITDCEGRTPLHVACEIFKSGMFRYLIQEGHANVEARDNVGRTPLHYTVFCCTSNISAARHLVKNCHANVEAADSYGRTPLHGACITGRIPLIRCLIQECHANVEAKDKNGWTPFFFVVCENYRPIDTVRFLLQECHVNVETIDNDGCTALCYIGKYDLDVILFFCTRMLPERIFSSSRRKDVNLLGMMTIWNDISNYFQK